MIKTWITITKHDFVFLLFFHYDQNKQRLTNYGNRKKKMKAIHLKKHIFVRIFEYFPGVKSTILKIIRKVFTRFKSTITTFYSFNFFSFLPEIILKLT